MKSATTDWVREFYRVQGELSGCYDGTVEEYHRKRAAALEGAHPSRMTSLRILELGAGAGQVAVALAERGHSVTAVEIVPEQVERALHNAEVIPAPEKRPRFLSGDFYEIDPGGPFDLICYLDGFGIGTDQDQRNLLKRIAGWLDTDGIVTLDIYTPWYWAAMAPDTPQHIGNGIRRYGFDAVGCRMLDHWRDAEQEDSAVTQSLRCYSPADLHLLLENSGLRAERFQPGSGRDRATGRWINPAPLRDAMYFTAILSREG